MKFRVGFTTLIEHWTSINSGIDGTLAAPTSFCYNRTPDSRLFQQARMSVFPFISRFRPSPVRASGSEFRVCDSQFQGQTSLRTPLGQHLIVPFEIQ